MSIPAPTSPKSGSIFHTYDIRGIYPSQIDERRIALIVRAAASYAKIRLVLLGHDARLSSPALHAAAKDALVGAGFDVLDIGVSSTDLFYFSVEHFKVALGIMVTASHNPAPYNGLKIVGRHARPIAWGSGLERIEEIHESMAPRKPGAHGPSRKGRIIVKDAIREFARFCRSFVDMPQLERGLAAWTRRKGKQMRVVLDAGDGLAAILAPQVFERMGIEPVLLFFDLDGRFPGQGPNPLDMARLGELRRVIREKHADLGVTWDADTDRVVFFDEHGNFVAPDIMLALLATHLLEHKREFPAFSGTTIVCDAVSSRFVEDQVRAHGGKLVRTPIGQAFIKPEMLRRKALVGGERSGHMTFRKGSFCTDNGYIPLLLVLAMMARTARHLSSLARPAAAYYRSPEINIPVKDSHCKDAAIEQVEMHYGRFCPAQIRRLDGITIEFSSWWCNLRPSNTEPLLRLHVEANTAKELALRVVEIKSIVARALARKAAGGAKAAAGRRGGHR